MEDETKAMIIGVVKEGFIRPAIISRYLFLTSWHRILFGTDIVECGMGLRERNRFEHDYKEANRRIRNE